MTSARVGSSFLDNPGWDYRWFHRAGAGPLGFHSWEFGPSQEQDRADEAAMLMVRLVVCFVASKRRDYALPL
jgi:hypothetical protein